MSDPQQPAPQRAMYPPPYSPERPRLPESTPVYTPLIWLITLLPLLGTLVSLLTQPHYGYREVDGIRTIDPLSIFTPAYFAGLGLSLVLYALLVVLAWLDRRELMRRGVERPFHWAWAFLSSIVYVIGRSVIVHRVANPRGLVPVWVAVGTIVVGVVVALAVTLSSMSGLTLYR